METKLTKTEIKALELLAEGNPINANDMARHAFIRTGRGFYDTVTVRWASYEKFVEAKLVSMREYDFSMWTGHISIAGRAFLKNS